MTFDPFGDFAEKGYLRNLVGETDPAIVQRLEHSSFVTGLQPAFNALSAARTLTYDNILSTHKTLFEAFYPWAGEDRLQTSPELAVSKGGVLFAHPGHIRAAIDVALRTGQDKAVMAAKPGEVMGYLAFGHPFLDGNGRTIMVVHSMLAQRAGLSIDWAKTNKADYLAALTKEIETPHKGHLDAYLKPFKAEAIALDKLADAVQAAPGLDGAADADTNRVLGNTSEPAIKAGYEQLQIQRKQK